MHVLFPLVCLQVDNCVFPIHRNILSACSPYFHAMFTNAGFETNQREITLTGVSPQIMMLIIDYAYTRASKVSIDDVGLHVLGCRVDILGTSEYSKYVNMVLNVHRNHKAY